MKDLGPNDPRQLGAYEVTHRLGSGGMGTVYLGRGAQGLVAIKTPKFGPSGEAELRMRFAREAACAMNLNSAYVVEVLDHGEDDSLPWLAMRYLNGQNLESATRTTGLISQPRLGEIALDLARGLLALHESGLVHRDIKPSNIMLVDGRPVIVDLGLARVVSQPALTIGAPLGTARWASPEQHLGWTAGPRSDVFSWGMCVLYAASGEVPFTGVSERLLSDYVTRGDMVDVVRVPEALREVVRVAINHNPELRPSSSGLVEALQNVVDLLARSSGTPGPYHGRSAIEPWGRTSVAAAPVPEPVAKRSVLAPVRQPGLLSTHNGTPRTALRPSRTKGGTVYMGFSSALTDRTWAAASRSILGWTGAKLGGDHTEGPMAAFGDLRIVLLAEDELVDRAESLGVAVLPSMSGLSGRAIIKVNCTDPSVMRWLCIPSSTWGSGHMFSTGTLSDAPRLILVDVDGRRVGGMSRSEILQQFAHHGRPWTAEAQVSLREAFEEGLTLAELTRVTKRTPSATCSALVDLGLLEASQDMRLA